MEHVAAIIPTRAGSKGLADKSMAVIDGHSLIHHAVRQALRTIGSAFVITDSPAHAAEARDAGAVSVVVDYRVPDDAIPEQQEQFAMGRFPALFEPYSSVCRLFVTHPLRADRDIMRGLGLHRETQDTVVSVSRAEHREHQVVLRDGPRWVPRSADPRRPRQQVQPPETYLVGCFYFAPVASYLRHAFWPPEGFRVTEVPTVRAFDVDTAEDLARARLLWRLKGDLDRVL